MQTKTHVLKRALARRERDELFAQAAIAIAGGRYIVFHVEVVDKKWNAIPGVGLDLVVKAATTDDAFTAWEHHAESVGGVGEHRVKLTYVRPATEERPATEMECLKIIDLDMRALLDDLGDLYDEDVALGLAIPNVF